MTTAKKAAPGIFAELRRRRVLRTLALYIVSAWLVMQVADVVFPALDIPERGIRYLLIAAVAGCPVALVFGWFFDISDGGIQRTGPADASDVAAPLRAPDYLLLAALAAVLGAIVYGAIDTVVEMPSPSSDAFPAERAPRGDGPPLVAVLPFTFQGAVDEAEFFARGVHDDLLTQLSRLSGLRVVSRTSMLAYGNTTKTIPVIGEELGADAILEGGVQLAGEQIRINAQLIDARSDQPLWAETFDRELTPRSIFAVQAEIAREISGALHTRLTAQEVEELELIPTTDLAAYRLYHQAQGLIYDEYRPDRERGIELLQQAIELDPRFTAAMVRMVYALTLTNFGGRDAAKAAQAEVLIERIGQLAPDSLDFLVARAYYVYYVIRDYDTAERLLEQARERAPSNIELVHIQSWIAKRNGDFDGWIDLTYLGRRLEPNEERWDAHIVYRLSAAHRYDEALSFGESVSEPTRKLAMRLARLRLLQHHDLSRYRAELLEASRTAGASDDLYVTELSVLAHLALRDYEGAVRALRELPAPGLEDRGAPPDRVPLREEWLLQVLFLMEDKDGLAETLRTTRALLGLDTEEGDERFSSLFFGDRYLLALAGGDLAAARQALTEMGEVIAGDIAPMIVLRPIHCRGLAMLGDAAGAVRCLRNGTDRPSDVMPFFEPLLPYYDGVRDSTVFEAFMASLRADGWLPADA